ncbi:MAG: GC-type dockerin domain-anchored protein [Phycisphaerales bacterium]
MRSIPLATLMLASTLAHSAERDLQFTTIFGDSRIIAIRNTGDTPMPLDGWRLCTQNSTSGPMMSDPGTLDGVTIPAHSSIIIRYNNDALPTRPTHFNASDFVDIAPFELDAYAISLYFPDASGEVDFNNPDQMADHIQWKRNLISNDFGTLCSPVAQDAGLWADASEWIYVRVHMYLIELRDQNPGEPDSPDVYSVSLDCRGDLSDDGILDFFDISAFISYFAAQHPLADFSNDGIWDFFDVSLFLSAYSEGQCPNFGF